MPVFEYKGLTAKGKNTKGLVEADSDRQARTKLKQQNIFLTSIKETNQNSREQKSKFTTFGISLNRSFQKVALGDLSIATRQLSTLVGAGIPLVEALRALSNQIESKRLKSVFSDVGDRVNEGLSLSKALSDYPKIFPNLYVNMIASGEISGTLEVVFERLADLLEAQADLKRRVVTAAVYPGLMLVMCVLVVVFLLAYVVPQITQIFQDQNKELPGPTAFIISLSEIIRNYWFIILGFIFLIVLAFKKYTATVRGRYEVDKLKLRFPMIGKIVLKASVARMAKTMGTMLASGVEMLTTLSIVKNIIGNRVLEEELRKASVGVSEGRALSDELKKSNAFPMLLIHLIAIGEKTGRLEQMLLKAAKTYEAEVDAVISSFTKILEPILILFFAVIVGGIVFAMLMPLMEMGSFGPIQ